MPPIKSTLVAKSLFLKVIDSDILIDPSLSTEKEYDAGYLTKKEVKVFSDPL
jgi:hypothetical protein